MKNLITLIMIALVGVSSATFARTQSATNKTGEKEWSSLLKQTDKNKDGKVSKDEYLTIFKDRNVGEAKFKSLDKDGDGFVTQEEYIGSLNSGSSKGMDEKK